MISDYLKQLLKHAKTRLEATGDLFPESRTEFVLCVPNLWSESACRIMHDAMASAIQSSGFAALTRECIDNLFIVAEPEAAAEFVLSSFLEQQKIRAGETFVMLDAGGGTVDATTYKLTRSDPVRRERQAVKHGADVCGSSFLNDGYKKRIEDRLQKVSARRVVSPADELLIKYQRIKSWSTGTSMKPLSAGTHFHQTLKSSFAEKSSTLPTNQRSHTIDSGIRRTEVRL